MRGGEEGGRWAYYTYIVLIVVLFDSGLLHVVTGDEVVYSWKNIEH